MEINTNKYRVYDWSHFMMLHWILNPGLVVNELILGQRIPKKMLEDKASNKPRYERTFIPCPHCDTLHDGRTWSMQNKTAFRNWFGLYCPSCGGIIPCLMNLTTLLILTATFPLWGWFRKSLREKWLAKQPERFKDIKLDFEPNPFTGKGWIVQGLTFGSIMFVLNAIGLPLIFDEEITLLKLTIAIPIWLLGGLAYGYAMKKFASSRFQSKDFNGYFGRKP